MLYLVITHTPIWVWALLALLVWLGMKQAVTSTIGLRRVTVMPLGMTALSLYGTVSAFGARPGPIVGWLLCALLVAGVAQGIAAPAGTHYDPAARSFTLPGSWTPLALMMGIFATKYVVGVGLAMHPDLAHDTEFALVVGCLYGIFSGMFAGRAARLWRLVHRSGQRVASSAA